MPAALCLSVNIHFMYNITGSDATSVPKSPIIKTRLPMPGFTQREAYRNIKVKQKDQHASILHLYGIPGTGRTEIVRKLAEEFPYQGNEMLLVKYEIDCGGDHADIARSLGDLLYEMLSQAFGTNNSAVKYACAGLLEDSPQLFVKLLCEASLPIVIIIQDPPKESKKLMDSIVLCLKDATHSKPVHLYVTSNSKSTLYHQSNIEEYEVTGFAEEEGLKLLLNSQSDSSEETKAAADIFKSLSGSPLGLFAVKTYCQMLDITYNEYLQLQSHLIYAEIKHDLEKQFGANYKHVFETVVALLDTKEELLNQLKTVSMFHHGNIPRRLIGKVMQRHRKVSNEKPAVTQLVNKKWSGLFINRLADFTFCKIDKKGTDSKVTFHQVVFSAVQELLKSRDQYELKRHLKYAILAISSVVNKDLRKRTDKLLMKCFVPHIQAVLKHFEDFDMCEKDFLMKMAAAHLYEVLGAIFSSSFQTTAEKYLKSSISMIWAEITQRACSNLNFDVVTHKQNIPTDEYAKEIIEICVAAGEDLRHSGVDIIQYASVILQIKDEDLNFLNKFTRNEEFEEYFKNSCQYCVEISSQNIKKLRSEPAEIFLGEDKHYKVFFTERLISVVYSLSRVILYDVTDMTEDERDTFVWMADLVTSLCRECKRVTGVSLLFFGLSPLVQVDVRLKNEKPLTEEQKKNVYRKHECSQRINSNKRLQTMKSCMKTVWLRPVWKTNFYTWDTSVQFCGSIPSYVKCLQTRSSPDFNKRQTSTVESCAKKHMME